MTGEKIVVEGQLITPQIGQKIEDFLGRDGKIRVVVEALFGQIYLVTVVALMVGNLRPRNRG